jgi:hypothetical protein
VRVNGDTVIRSQYNAIGRLNSIEKTTEFFYSLHYRQSKNPAKAFVNLFIMEEAVAGTSTVAPLDGIESVIGLDDGIDVDNLIDSIDPIRAPFNPSTPNTVVEVPTSIICNPNRSPRDKSIKDMKNKEDALDDGYDSDGGMGPFYNRTDKEGPQLFNEEDDNGVGFVAGRAIDDERGVGADMDAVDDEVYVPILLDEINKMNLIQLRNELRLRQESSSGAKFKLKEQLIEALDKKVPKYTEEALAKKKAAASEAKKKNPTQGLSFFSKTAFWKELPNEAAVQEPTNPTFKIQRLHALTVPQEDTAHVPVKHDFNHTFDVPPFAGKTTACMY